MSGSDRGVSGPKPTLTVAEAIAGLPAVRLTPESADGSGGQPISGGYACDMLSLVMSRIQPGEAWFTILNSMNVIAVAVLAECALVILTDGVTMEPPVLARAVQQNVTIVSTRLTTYQACVRLNALLSGSCGPAD